MKVLAVLGLLLYSVSSYAEIGVLNKGSLVCSNLESVNLVTSISQHSSINKESRTQVLMVLLDELRTNTGGDCILLEDPQEVEYSIIDSRTGTISVKFLVNNPEGYIYFSSRGALNKNSIRYNSY